MTKSGFDVVVVGGGSSGGVVAARLSELADCDVLLLEAGPDFPDEAESPPAFLTGGTSVGEGFAGVGAATPDLDWGYCSEPLASGRRVHLRRGRMVGGSSMVNGCVCVRGRPADYDAWEDRGAVGWGWDALRADFELVEREVPIRRYPRESLPPLEQLFVDGFAELGFRRTEDLNQADAWDGVVGPWPQNRRNEVRQGTLVTYIRRARGRPNLEIRGRALVDRVLMSGSRATGVRYIDASGHAVEIRAGSVVLAAGAYGSAPILLRSGIGPAGDLRDLGVRPVEDLPVGLRLMDHAQCLFEIDTPPEVARLAGPWYAVAARGASFWSFPLAVDEEVGRGVISFGSTFEDMSGRISILSSDPRVPPRIEHLYDAAIGRGDFEEAWSMFHAVLATAALSERGVRSGEAGRTLAEVLGERLGTAFHPAGGCPIGGVVDERLAVRGIDGLWVADASVFPGHVTNNPNLTCFVVGERAARFVAPRTP